MKKQVLCLLLTLILMALPLCIPAHAEDTVGTTYYVDATSGSNLNDGTSATNAWKSITKVNETTFLPGDKILFKKGETFHGILYPLGSGTEENPITLGAYGDGDQLPIISTYLMDLEDDRSELIETAIPSSTAGIYLKDQSYWTIENLKVTFSSESAAAGIYVCTSKSEWQYGITIRNCVVEGNGTTRLWQNSSYLKDTGGIYVGHNGSYKGYFNGVTIDGNVVRDVKGVGINAYGSQGGVNASHDGGTTNAMQNVLVENNYLYHIGKDGILVNNCVRPVVQYNVCDGAHSAYNDTNAYVAIWPFASYQALLQYNEAYNTKTINDGQGFDSDYMCVGTTIQYNYSHHNEGGFILICTEAKDWAGNVAYNEGTVVRYNIGENNQHYDFTISGGVKDTYIYNNTVYNSWYKDTNTNVVFAFNKGGYAKNLYFYNNIIYSDFEGRYQWWSTKNVAQSSIESPETDPSLVRDPSGNLVTNGSNYYQKTSQCENVVWENNLLYGRVATGASTTSSYTGAPKNDTQQGVDTNLDGIKAYGNVTADPLFFEENSGVPGLTTTDMTERVAGYRITTDSKALGAGQIVENPSCYPCTTDFYGNPAVRADGKINIGADNGMGVEPKEVVYEDNYYVDLVDYEKAVVGAQKKSIPFITYTYSADNKVGMQLVSGDAKFTGLYGSTKAVKVYAPALTDTNASTKFSMQINMTVRSYKYLSKSNAMRFWMSGNGTSDMRLELKYKLAGTSTTLSKHYTIPKNGGWLKLDYAVGQAPGSVQFNFSSIPAGASIYMDDMQLSLRDTLGISDSNTTTAITVSTTSTTKPTTSTTIPEPSSTPQGPSQTYELGDLNCDGKINSLDLLLLKRKILQID